MNQATIGRRTYQVAGTFNELSGRQLSAVAGLLHSGLPVIELKLRLLLVLLQLRFRFLLQWLLLRKVSDEQRQLLTLLTDFCFRDPRLTKQPYPVLRTRWYSQALYGPACMFSDLSFAEWIDASAHFDAYRHEKEVRHLDLLVATLWRPSKATQWPTGCLPVRYNKPGARADYDPASVADRVRLVARLPLGTKLAIRMWFACCQTLWVKRYTGTVFKKGEGTQEVNIRTVWHEVLAERAGSPDRYELMGQQSLPNMLFDLDLRIRRRQEEQDALRRQRRS